MLLSRQIKHNGSACPSWLLKKSETFKLKATIIPLSFLTALNAQASYFSDYMIDPEDGMFDTSRFLSEVPFGFFPVPVIITEPATGNGLGVAAIFFNESAEEKQQRLADAVKNNRPILPNNISVVAAGATENGSKAGGIGHFGFWFKDRLRYQGFALYPDINLDFYSLSGFDLPRAVELNIVGPVVLQRLKWRMGESSWFVGGKQLYRTVETNFADGDFIANIQSPALQQQLNDFIAERLGGDDTTSGLGISVEYDSRNNPMSPETGFNYVIEYTRFDDAFGSDVNYDSYLLKGLNYWNLSDKFNLGIRLQYDAVNADSGEHLPANVPPMINLRGVPAMRYQGNNVATTEAELTYQYDMRWSFKTFTGAGRAAQNRSDLSEVDTIDSYGVGFRYLIAKRYGFRAGIDVAKGPEDTAIYIKAGSTW